MTPERKEFTHLDPGQKIPGRFRPYLSAFLIRLQQNLQYRAAAFAGMATQLFWGLMLIMVLEAFYRGSDAVLPMTLSQLAAYIWLQQSFLVFIALWYRDGEIFGMITSGQVAYELCRPTNLYYFWQVRLLAQRLAGALLRCFPILLLAFLMPVPYRMTLPSTLPAFLLFCLTSLTGLLVNVSISMFIYILTFVTLSPVGSLLLIGVVGEFCAGMIIPIPFMPDWLQTILYLLPFRLTADLPFRIWSGHIPLQSALSGWVWQLAWLTALIVTGRLAMRKVLLRVVALALMIIGGTVIFYGIFMLAATLCFWTLQGLEVANIFTDGGREMAQYPLDIYRTEVMRFFTYVIPFGAVNYLPLHYLLGHSDSEPWQAFIPLVSLVFLIPCLLAWRAGIRHYQSAGS